jgi:hypothetical protein
MRVIADRAAAEALTDPALRTLITQRIDALEAEGDDVSALATFIAIEPGDDLAATEQQLGFPLLANPWTGVRYGEPGFTPAFELAEDHGAWYELVYVLSDDGTGAEVFVANALGVDRQLLAMCAAYALPPAEHDPP